MKKITKLLFLPILIALFGAFTPLMGGNTAKAVNAEAVPTYPKNGSGNILLVNGSGTYFKSGEADCAVYFFNSESDNQWSEKCNYRISGDTIRVMVPYKNGTAKTWSKLIVCRYNPALDPLINGWDGVYNQTEDIQFSSFLYNQNTVNITGYKDSGKLNHSLYYFEYHGIRGNNHMYLDLSTFTDWEQGGAKFAIYFAYPEWGDSKDWSLGNSSEGYHLSFCWKVNGQSGNDHLYECIVPGTNRVWNLVIAVRFNPIQGEPGWYNMWNQTQDLHFTSSNHNANMIRVTDWDNSAYLDADNIISKESRVDFYGKYFLDNVTCSGSGASDATTTAMWNTVKDEYVNHLSTTFQGDVWKAKGDKESEKVIEQAMARYDYIVFYKEYDHEDFIGRDDSPNKTEYSSLVSPIENNIDKQQQVWPVAIVAFVIAMGGLSTLLIIKVRKNKRQ